MKIALLFVLSSLVSSFALADEMTLLFIKSPGINWNSPKTLANSTASSFDEPYGLGHVNIIVSCAGRKIETGIFNRWKNDTRNAVLLEGNGLGVLFRVFEGTIQSPKKIVADFEKMAAAKRGNFLRILISSSTCARLLEYHDAYQELVKNRQSLPRKKNGPVGPHQQIYYGFPAVPRAGEGAGCSGFAMGYLEVAGLKEPWMEEVWSRYLLVPAETVGHPLRKEKVSLLSLIRNAPKAWSLETEPHFPLFFWDPDLMYNYIENVLKTDASLVTLDYGARGLILDRREVPTPNGSVFLGDVYQSPTDPTQVYRDPIELVRRLGLVRN